MAWARDQTTESGPRPKALVRPHPDSAHSTRKHSTCPDFLDNISHSQISEKKSEFRLLSGRELFFHDLVPSLSHIDLTGHWRGGGEMGGGRGRGGGHSGGGRGGGNREMDRPWVTPGLRQEKESVGLCGV